MSGYTYKRKGRMSVMRGLHLVALASIAAVSMPSSAEAHATLLRSEPADGAVLEQSPTQVLLVFDDTIIPAPGTEAILNGGSSILAGAPFRARDDSHSLVIPVRTNLREGDYSVRWRVVSDDGHVIAGVVAFAVGAGRSSPQPALTADEGSPRVWDVLSRWLFLLGLLVAVGSIAFRYLVWQPALHRSRNGAKSASAAGDRLQALVVLVGASLCLVGALASLRVNELAGATRFGRMMEVAALLAALTVAGSAASLRDHRIAALGIPPAVLLLLVPALAGHALDPGRSHPLAVATDVLHLATVAVWLGGLVQLVIVVPRATRGMDEGIRGELSAEVARRFSSIALAAVAVLVVSGVVRAATELSAFDQLWTTSYGRVVLVKSALLCTLLAVGWVNRFRLVPRLIEAGGSAAERLRAATTLRLMIVGELGVLAMALVAVAVLVTLRPGRELPLPVPAAAAGGAPASGALQPRREALVLAKEDGERAVALAVGPRDSELELQASVLAPEGTGVPGLRVHFTVDSVGESRTVAAAPCGAGCYRATLPVARKPELVTMRLEESSRSSSVTTFPMPARWPAQKGDRIVRRATRTYRSLRSLVIHERLASNPWNAVFTTYEIVAPNRLAYEVAGGSAAVLIGGRRWDRHPGEGWRRSANAPIRQPTPFWGPDWTNAHVVGSTRVDGRPVWVVTLLDPRVPSWFTLWIDKETFRTHELEMVAAAHFMHHRYESFDAPLTVAPPR